MQTNTHRNARTHMHTVRSTGVPPSGSPGRRGAVGAQLGRALWSGPAGWTSGRASGTLIITFSITHTEPKETVYTSLRDARPDEDTDKQIFSLNRHSVLWVTFDGQLMSLWKKRTVSLSDSVFPVCLSPSFCLCSNGCVCFIH